MKGLTTLVALLFFASAAIGDDHESGYLVEIGEGLSLSSHICKLQGRATLADVDKIDVRLHKWQDANGLEVVRSRLEPLFVGPPTMDYDYIAVDWMTWDSFGKGWDAFMSSKEGQDIFADYNKIMECSRMVGSIYPMMRKPTVTTDDYSIVTINWCSRKEGVSQDALISKHRDYRDKTAETTTAQWWGIGYPSAGAREGAFPGEFYHWVTYSDMSAYAEAQDRMANEEGWRSRQDYYDSYADCSGEILMNHTVVKRK